MKSSLLSVSVLCLLNCSFQVYGQEQVLPKPVSVEIKEGKPCFINKGSAIVLQSDKPEFRKKAEVLKKFFSSVMGQEMPIVKKAPQGEAQGACIFIKEDKGLLDKGKDAYSLSGGENGIVISAGDPRGVFYAFQSLKQMLPAHLMSDGKVADGQLIKLSDSGFEIVDYPRFSWRALMIDEARHFFGVEAIKQIIDQMALMKMNVLHWHLTDDAGWRIEIKKYPRLTEVGSIRNDTEADHWHSGRLVGKPHSGFYTQDQIKEVVKYAMERNITIVPEIEMPGHASAASVAYPELSLKAPKEIQPQFAVNVAYNPTREKTYEFLSDVLDEVIALFPGDIIHSGGDEVRYHDQWGGQPEIEAFMKKHKMKTLSDVQMHFSNRMSQIIAKKGKRMMGWNDIYGHDVNNEGGGVSAVKLDTSAQIHFWKGDSNLAKAAIKDGHDVVNSTHSSTYLDYSYGSISLDAAYNFEPIFAGLDEQYHSKVKGLGCQMWTEWVPTVKRLHEQVFPRVCAYAETGWTPKESKDFLDFRKRLLAHTKRMDAMGIQYSKQFLDKLYIDDFADEHKVYRWSPESFGSGEVSCDVTDIVKKAGIYTFCFIYDKGSNGVDIESVVLEEDGRPISRDEHVGFSGGSQDYMRYFITVAKVKDKARYTLKSRMMGRGGNDSHGTLCVQPPESKK